MEIERLLVFSFETSLIIKGLNNDLEAKFTMELFLKLNFRKNFPSIKKGK